MNRIELTTAREQAVRNLDTAIALRAEAEKRLTTVPASSASASLYTGAKSLAQTGVDRAVREIAHIDRAIASYDAATAAGARGVEMLPADVVDTVTYASVVIGVGVDPDHPEKMRVQAVVRHEKKKVCPRQAAEIIRRFADDLEATATCGPSHS